MTVPEKAFVNSFWGLKDDGFAVIQMRIKTSLQTLHELLEFYKERITIEKEYNKKLSKLAGSVNLGSSEVGTLKIALDKLQGETGHMVAQNQTYIKNVQFQNYEKLHHFCTMYAKNTAKIEGHMSRLLAKKHEYYQFLENAKEKFRTACGQQKTLTLLCQTTWGKELDKNTAKLHKVQDSLAGLEKNYQQAVQNYHAVHEAWSRDWAISLQTLFQLEIERIQVCKLNCFAFCNHIASLCVDWDSSADQARASFAAIGAPKDVSDFVGNYGTGSQISAPPQYVDFLNGFEESDEVKFSVAEFADPDYTQILSRTFSTHSNVISRNPEPVQQARPQTIQEVPTGHADSSFVQYSPVKPADKSLPPIKTPQESAKSIGAGNGQYSGNIHLSPNHSPSRNTGALRKQPSHNSNYTSATDEQDIFERRAALKDTSSDYSAPTNYSSHTGRSWSSPRKKSAQEKQKEINRKSQDMSVSGLFSTSVSPQKVDSRGANYDEERKIKEARRKSMPVSIAKDFSIDFIAKALEDLNAGGDGDMNRFRRSVRLENERTQNDDIMHRSAAGPSKHMAPAPASDFVDDRDEIAQRHDSISFRSPARIAQQSETAYARNPENNNFYASASRSPAKSPGHPSYADSSMHPADGDSIQTVIQKSSVSPRRKSQVFEQREQFAKSAHNPARRSLSQSPTKSYVNLSAMVDHVTPVTRNDYVTKAVAKYNYVSREEGELSFKKGWHMFVIHKQEDNWYVCELGENCGNDRGSVGLVPYNYVVEGERAF